MTHTPGPWEVTSGLGCKDIGPADAMCSEGIYEVGGTYGIAPESEDRANAELMAAAPELSAVCKDKLGSYESPANTLRAIAETFDEKTPWHMWLRRKAAQMDAAIAKAEGKQ